MTSRLFIALAIDISPFEAMANLYSDLLNHEGILKVVSPENYHITLKFLGDTDDSIGDSIITDMGLSTERTRAIPYSISGLGAFPGISNPKIFWCGIDTDIEEIRRLHSDIERFCESLGFKKEIRPFRPHLTIGRLRKGRSCTQELKEYIRTNRETLYGNSSFSRVSLFESRLHGDGPIYTEIAGKELS